nr:hypothetical protein [Parachlamydiaceae bacterium]
MKRAGIDIWVKLVEIGEALNDAVFVAKNGILDSDLYIRSRAIKIYGTLVNNNLAHDDALSSLCTLLK